MHPYFPSDQFIVSVARGRRVRYIYGETLKQAMDIAKLKKGDCFCYARFKRGPVQWAEVTQGKPGNVLRLTSEAYIAGKHFSEVPA